MDGSVPSEPWAQILSALKIPFFHDKNKAKMGRTKLASGSDTANPGGLQKYSSDILSFRGCTVTFDRIVYLRYGWIGDKAIAS